MNASELRIGNLIRNNKTGQVYPVDGTFIMEVERWGIDDLMTNPPKPIFAPIQITEEWLFKFGFDQSFEDVENSNSYYFLSPDGIGGFHVYRDNEAKECIGVVYYVHQLQNLYFALTSEELTIKQ
jgi:hypothetical protein